MSDALPLDPAIPFLEDALDVAYVTRLVGRSRGIASVRSARLHRHKPGRRCLIEYEVDTGDHSTGMIGKIRAKGLDRSAFRIQQACRNAGLPVAEPLFTVPELSMWMQRKLSGTVSTALFTPSAHENTAVRTAELIRSLHTANIPAPRRHSIHNELEILRDRLGGVIEQYPAWSTRLTRILHGCQRLACRLKNRPVTSIHRDFYPDQVITDARTAYLIDLDLLASGDPALDVGNFIAHLTEMSLRLYQHPDALRHHEVAFEERYLQLAGDSAREAVRIYTLLTLARHIQLSTQFEDRGHTTVPLMGLCEERLQSLGEG